MIQPRIFLDVLPWDVRSRNTDWRYVRYALPRLKEYEPGLEITIQSSRLVTVLGNLKAARAAAGWRVGLPTSPYRRDTSRLSAGQLAASRANVIFAQRSLPLNAGSVPVVWENAIVDPAMQLAYGVTPSQLEREIELKRRLFPRAAAIQVFTEAEAKRHRTIFPEVADRFHAIPWFAPHVRPAEFAGLQKHRNPGTVRLLFVGNQAHRKGLDQLLAAFCALPHCTQQRALLTVISNFDRCHIDIPANDRITVLGGATSERVMDEMRRAHIFVNVARFETYGVVFLEAMSQGNACLAPDWEVQRELFDDGRAGEVLSCRADSIRASLLRLIEDDQARYALGLAAWTRYQQNYAPAVVARRYAQVFSDVVNPAT